MTISLVAECGIESGRIWAILNTSFMTDSQYGIFGLSSMVGKRALELNILRVEQKNFFANVTFNTDLSMCLLNDIWRSIFKILSKQCLSDYVL